MHHIEEIFFNVGFQGSIFQNVVGEHTPVPLEMRSLIPMAPPCSAPEYEFAFDGPVV